MSIPRIGVADQAARSIDIQTGEISFVPGPSVGGDEPRGAFSASTDRTLTDAVPPVGNTGVHLSRSSPVGTVINCDWISLTAHTDFEVVRGVLETVGLGALEKLDIGTRFCTEAYSGLFGLRVEAVPRNKSQHWTAVSLSGECCHWLGAAGVQRLARAFLEKCNDLRVKLKCSRWDQASDTQSFSAEWFAQAVENDARLPVGSARRLIGRRSEAWSVQRSENGGCTTYLGASESDKRLVVYHKLDGDTFGVGVAFTRVEQRFRGDAANAAFLAFCWADLADWPALTAGLLNDYVQVDKRWWRSFVGTVEKAFLVVHRLRSTVAKTKAWLQRAVAPALAMVVDAENVVQVARGREFLAELLRDGRDRRSPVMASRVRNNQSDGLPRFAVYGFGGVGDG